MITSSFTPPENYKKPLEDGPSCSAKLVRGLPRQSPRPSQSASPLECRWSLASVTGFVNCAQAPSGCGGRQGGQAPARKLFETGKFPVDMTQSPDGKHLFVSCFFGDEIQQWDVSDLKKPKLVKKVTGLNQPNMLHLTGDGQRMYVTNSLLSTMDRDEKFWVKLINVTKDGMALAATFVVDLTKFKTGPARGHDMLLY